MNDHQPGPRAAVAGPPHPNSGLRRRVWRLLAIVVAVNVICLGLPGLVLGIMHTPDTSEPYDAPINLGSDPDDEIMGPTFTECRIDDSSVFIKEYQCQPGKITAITMNGNSDLPTVLWRGARAVNFIIPPAEHLDVHRLDNADYHAAVADIGGTSSASSDRDGHSIALAIARTGSDSDVGVAVVEADTWTQTVELTRTVLASLELDQTVVDQLAQSEENDHADSDGGANNPAITPIQPREETLT